MPTPTKKQQNISHEERKRMKQNLHHEKNFSPENMLIEKIIFETNCFFLDFKGWDWDDAKEYF